MPKLLMLKGLPASGKSSFAQALVEEGWVEVNKDKIRADLKDTWTSDLEKRVIKIRDNKIKQALSVKKNVVSSDTNLAPKHEARFRQLASEFKATFEIDASFLEVPIEECIRRDSLRKPGEGHVGEGVIRGMFEQYLKSTTEVPKPVVEVVPTFQPYVGDPNLPPAILCDLDGTLSLSEGIRGIFDYDKCDQDKVNQSVATTIAAMSLYGYQVVFVSGREEKAREKTLMFLAKVGAKRFPLFMRPTGDFRKDWVIKGEIFDREIRPKYNVLFCLDDRDQVVNFYRGLGLTVFQVREGNY